MTRAARRSNRPPGRWWRHLSLIALPARVRQGASGFGGGKRRNQADQPQGCGQIISIKLRPPICRLTISDCVPRLRGFFFDIDFKRLFPWPGKVSSRLWILSPRFSAGGFSCPSKSELKGDDSRNDPSESARSSSVSTSCRSSGLLLEMLFR